MPVLIDLVDPWIFVDDDDPGIVYDDADAGVWVAERGLPTDLQVLTGSGAISTPAYGTLHSTGTQSEPYVFNYKFNGTSYFAQFSGGLGIEKPPCTVDGDKQQLGIGDGVFECTSTGLSPIEHNLTVEIEITSSFDGLYFMPVEFPNGGVDALYRLDPQLASSDSYEFTFHGISAGVYADMQFNSTENHTATTFSYTIDQGQPVNFTLVNPSQNPLLFLSSQLLIQTPPLSRGQHTLVMSMLDQGDLQSFQNRNIIVQNSSRALNLDAVPSLSSSSIISSHTSSFTSSSSFASSASSSDTTKPTNYRPLTEVSGHDHHISPGIIAAIALSIFVFILLSGVLMWRKNARSRSIADHHNLAALPFSNPSRPDRVPVFRLPQYVTSEKTRKYRHAMGILPQTTRDIEQEELHREKMEISTISIQDRQLGPTRIRYVVHEDGGEVREERGSQQGEMEERIINLPPMYSSLQVQRSSLPFPHRTPEYSRRKGDNTTNERE